MALSNALSIDTLIGLVFGIQMVAFALNSCISVLLLNISHLTGRCVFQC